MLHVNPQALPEHVAVALATAVVHVLPHVLQFVVLVVRLTQVPPQSASPVGQPEMHAAAPPSPAEHTGVPPVHATPHAPQFEAVFRTTQAPLQSV